MKVIIADDEELARSLLRTLLEELEGIDIAAEAEDGMEAVDLVREHRPDVLFLDIDMPQRNGILTALDLIPDGTDVIFVTAHEAHAIDAFELGAIDYILKPVRRVRLNMAVERARRRCAARLGPSTEGRLEMAPSRRERAFWVSTRQGTVRVAADDLVKIEAARDHVYLHTTERAYLHRITMTELEQELAGSGLLRVHRSAFVRPARVTATRRSGRTIILVLDEGSEVPVGPSYRDAVLEAIAD